MVLRSILGIWMAAVIAFVFLLPPDPSLGHSAKTIFFHVPMAWISAVAFLVALLYGALYLKRKKIEDDIVSSASAGIGFWFCLGATISGSIWAKATWGAYWNWDPRETSVFILLLIYGAYFALRSAVSDEALRARLAAVYAILAGTSMPFFIFAIPRLLPSLHPSPIIARKMEIDITSFALLLISLAGYTGIYIWLLKIRVRAEEVLRKG